MYDAISCIYWVGARSDLTQNWNRYNFQQPYSKLYYVEEGEIVVQIYGQTVKAGPGDLMLIPEKTVHSCWLPEDGYAKKCWCHFSLKNEAGKFFERFVLEPVLHVPNRAAVKKLFRQMFHSENLPTPQKELAATNAICSLVQYYFEHTNVIVREVASDRIKQVIDFIEQHYAENLTLEQLAQVAGYSTTHLSKRFHEVTGMPPIRYLSHVRIENAKHMLQYSDDPIGQIMEKCGFTDPAYFSRIIKKTLGFSPQSYRELYRSKVLFPEIGRKKV